MDSAELEKAPLGKMDADKNGDVLLEVGEGEKLTLRVSSKILTTVSPVFRAMFSGGFAESQNLSSTSPRVVPLPEDDKDAMRLLSLILHFRYDEVPTELDCQSFVRLATVCDKYDCVLAVKPWALVWVNDLLPKAAEPGYEALLYIAYALNLPKLFNSVTKSIIYERANPIIPDVACGGNEVLLGHLPGSISPLSIISSLPT